MNTFFLIISISLIIGLLYYKNNNKFIGGNINKVIDLRCQPYIKKKICFTLVKFFYAI